MTTLDIEKFNPTKAELMALGQKYKDLCIQDVNDKEGYLQVKNARKELQETRIQIEKDGKMLRSEAVSFQKAVIEKEKELIALIEPIELDLKSKQKKIDEEKEKIKRRKLLPERIQKLKEIETTVAEDFLLLLDDEKFNEFYNQKNAEYLAKKAEEIREEKEEFERKQHEEKEAAEKKIKEEQEKIKEEKRKLEEEKMKMVMEKKHQIELENAKKEAAEKAIIEAKQKAEEDEHQKILVEQNRKLKEKEEQEKLEKRKKYQAFLAQHNYENNDNFRIEKTNEKIILYKKIGEFVV